MNLGFWGDLVLSIVHPQSCAGQHTRHGTVVLVSALGRPGVHWGACLLASWGPGILGLRDGRGGRRHRGDYAL